MPRWPRRAAWRTELSRHILRLGRVCISEIGAWLWSQVLFLRPHPTTCPRGAQRAELAGPACRLSGWGCPLLGMVSVLLRARVLEPGTQQASAAEQHPSCKDCRRSGQPSSLPGVRHRAARLCFCRTRFVSAFFILFLHCLVVCGNRILLLKDAESHSSAQTPKLHMGTRRLIWDLGAEGAGTPAPRWGLSPSQAPG